MAKFTEKPAPPEGKAWYILVYAGAGPCPAPFPEEWTPETAHSWAVECQRQYRPYTPWRKFLLTRSAFKLWLMAAGYSRERAREIVSYVREFP